MKRYVILSILCCWFAAAQAQSVGNISIGVVVPEQQDEIKSDAFRLLATRMKAIAASNAASSMYTSSTVASSPAAGST